MGLTIAIFYGIMFGRSKKPDHAKINYLEINQ